jgi:hypothetical protein
MSSNTRDGEITEDATLSAVRLERLRSDDDWSAGALLGAIDDGAVAGTIVDS